ncbi:hypothetical protein [Neorhodopirellula lusitana]
MKHRENIDSAVGHALYDAVVALEYLAQILAANLRNDLAGKRELSQSSNG